MSLAGELDWVAKLELLEGYRQREGLDWDAPKLHLVDLQYSDVRQDKGLYNRLVARGSMETLVTEDEVQAAVTAPPEDTRAYFRGRCLREVPDAGRRGVVGLGHLRRRARVAAAGADPRAAARHEGARRRPARRLRLSARPGRDADRQALI